MAGAYLVDVERIEDERGFFASLWNADEFRSSGLDVSIAELDIAWNARRGTLRGMHFQRPPFDHSKLVRCTMGAIFDVIVDRRVNTASRNRWYGVELTARDRRMLYIPPGFAHGYLTLADDTEVSYQMGGEYRPESAGGIRWNDPLIGIEWPETPTCILARDDSYPFLEDRMTST
jgi:dTDP-4-dehydrorhamnose 3,5-epimerase